MADRSIDPLPANQGMHALGRQRMGRHLRLILAALALTISGSVEAVTYSELLRDEKMNAKRFANHFAYFKYEYFEEVQPVDDFLAGETGDCDDYAVLAERILHRRKFNTVLVHIRLAGMVAHAVCYVSEDRAYLDYNNRNVFFTLARSGPTLREIATKVARSLDSNWTSASEFSYSYETRQKEMLATVVKTDPPEKDPVPGKSDRSKLLVN